MGVKYSTAGNPMKPRDLMGDKFSLRCSAESLSVNVTFSLLTSKQHQKVSDWLEQANAYVAYLSTEEYLYRKKQREEAFNYKSSNGKKGNADEWRKKAERIKMKIKNADEALVLLGLNEVPTTIKDLNKARRKAMLKAHPDHGGSDAQAQLVNQAYDQIKARIEWWNAHKNFMK